MRVLAAMSGGVDSAVAAARARRRRPRRHRRAPGPVAEPVQTLRTGARGCCTLEDAHDARRAADVLGIPFYIWDLAERFGPTWSTTSSPSTRPAARPTRACAATRRSSSARCSTARVALGFDAVVTGHHARLVDGRLFRSVDPAKDQSYVLGRAAARPAAHGCVPARRLHQGRGAGRGRRPWPGGGRQARLATTSASSPTATPAASSPGSWGKRPGDIVDADTGAVVGEHQGTFGFTVGQRRGLRSGIAAADGSAALRAVAVARRPNTVTVGTADDSRSTRSSPPTRCGRPAARPRPTGSATSSCARTVRSRRPG